MVVWYRLDVQNGTKPDYRWKGTTRFMAAARSLLFILSSNFVKKQPACLRSPLAGLSRREIYRESRGRKIGNALRLPGFLLFYATANGRQMQQTKMRGYFQNLHRQQMVAIRNI